MVRKGQAALEFLMTYGWAILVVLVVIGALAYFGVFNTGAIMPEKCNLGTGFGCNDYLISSTPAPGQVQLSITNGMGKGITVTSIQVDFKGNDGNVKVSCQDTTSHIINNGDSYLFTLDENGPSANCDFTNFDTSRKAKGIITLKYHYQDSTFTHTQEGELMAKVES